MTARVITALASRTNAQAAGRQEYRPAQVRYREVCRENDAGLPERGSRFRAALERREAAFERYMGELGKN